MNPVDSKEQELSLTDILSIVNQSSGMEVDLPSMVSQVVLLASSPTSKYMKLGNTAFIFIDGGDGVANVMVYNADTEQNLTENYVMALDAAKMLGFQQVYTVFDSVFLPFYDEFTDVYDAAGYQLDELNDGSFRLIIALRSAEQEA